jgi:ribosomal protein S18 acetylase RimI-like enzyme
MQIETVAAPSEEVWEALQQLVPQLTVNHPPPSRETLEALIRSESSKLLIARHPDQHGPIAGVANVTIYQVPTGTRAIIEDVIVDKSARRQGIGEALIRHALELARRAGAGSINLTSNPKRVAANKLYLKLGFVRRRTNSYQYILPKH